MQKYSRTVLVIDTGNPACDGKLNDRAFLNEISHTLIPYHELARWGQEHGIECITPDALLGDPGAYQGARILLITHLTNERTASLIAHGAAPFLLVCQESPFIATRFYLRFRALSKQFRYTMGFSGMRRYAHPKTTFLETRFPIFVPETLPSGPFRDRKLVALIAGNKSAAGWKALLLMPFYGRRVRLIYPLRKAIVGAFARARSIDLYGRGWEDDADPAVRDAARGLAPADGKLATLGAYRFTFAFENAIFPGYLTEKLFDAFLAGTVPVYLGDPDVTHTIPPDTFVDMRAFGNADELLSFLSDMDETAFHAYRTRIEEFLSSPAFTPFTHRSFIEQIHGLITK